MRLSRKSTSFKEPNRNFLGFITFMLKYKSNITVNNGQSSWFWDQESRMGGVINVKLGIISLINLRCPAGGGDLSKMYRFQCRSFLSTIAPSFRMSILKTIMWLYLFISYSPKCLSLCILFIMVVNIDNTIMFAEFWGNRGTDIFRRLPELLNKI